MPSFDMFEDSAFTSLVIAGIGTVSIALAALERLVSARDEAGKSTLRLFAIYSIVVLTLAINIGTHWWQYHTVVRGGKNLENEMALSLWAFRNNDTASLKYIAQNHRYILGYQHFRDGEYELAHRVLKEEIKKGKFVAPSNYILAVMARLREDRDKAKYHVEAAIAYDPNYSSAYMERGLLHALNDKSEAALNDIEIAIELSQVHCHSVNRNSTMDSHPLYRLRNEPRLRKLKMDCDAIEKKLLS